MSVLLASLNENVNKKQVNVVDITKGDVQEGITNKIQE
jgi:hypothetical protein